MKLSTLLCLVVFTLQLGFSQFNIELCQNQRNIGSQDSFFEHLEQGAVFNTNPEVFSEKVRAQRELIVSITMPNGKQETLILSKKKISTSDFELYLKSSSGKKLVTHMDYGSHYRGTVLGYEKSIANLSIFEDELIGMIVLPEQGTFNLAKLKNQTKDNYSSIIYAIEELKGLAPFECHITEDMIISPLTQDIEMKKSQVESCKAVRLYIEFDYYTYNNEFNRNLTRTSNYANGLLNNVLGLYENDDMRILVSEMVIWESPDGYPTETAPDALLDFTQQVQDDFDGDIATLVSTAPEGNGGLAFVNVLCRNYNHEFGYGRTNYCNTRGTFNDIPTYSWDVTVVTHEIGHNLGSPHTHDCFWNGNDTPIDDCAGTYDDAYRGDCSIAPLPDMGTIMSYCHLLSDVRISFLEGFGPQPRDYIQQRIEASSCINEQSLVDTEISYPEGRLCKGDTITISVDEGYTYEWLGGSTDSELSISSSGTYRVTVYDANLCSEIYQQDILFFNGPRNSLIYSDSLACHGDSLLITTLNPRGGNSYRWSNNSSDTSILVFNTQNVALTITDTFACKTELDLGVRFKELPDLFFQLDTNSIGACTGDSVHLIAYGGEHLRFFPALTDHMDSSFYALAGSYLVESETERCFKRDSFIIRDLGRPVPDIPLSYIICPDDNLIISASSVQDSNVLYIWNQEDTSFMYDVSTPSTYELEYINEYGCDTFLSINVSTQELPEIEGLDYNYIEGDSTYTVSISYLNDLFGNVSWEVVDGEILNQDLDFITVHWTTENDSAIVCMTIEVEGSIVCNTQEYCITVPTAIMTRQSEFVINSMQFTSSPNPFNDEFRIDYQLLTLKPVQLEIRNILGQIIETKQVSPSSKKGKIDVSTKMWPEGSYVVVIKQEDLYKAIKMIKF